MILGDVVHKTKYLKFIVTRIGKRTNRYSVFSVQHDFKLGEVHWYGAWFTYAFFPESDTVFNPECMRNIIAFIEKEMSKRRGG